MADQHPFLIVTGPSGAGLSSALKCLEDIGYEALDNFPLDLIPSLFEPERDNPKPIALGIDTRSRGFSANNIEKALGTRPYKILFIDCQIEKLQQRFSETRRTHPLAIDRPVIDGIHAEKNIMGPIRDKANIMIDTTDLSIHDLKRQLNATFGDQETSPLTIHCISFSYKRGLPRDADLVFDVRFLKNPHWQETLRAFTGKDHKVQKHISEDALFTPFIEKLKETLTLLLPAYEKEGKRYLTIAFGCTGGKHRSVFCTETIKDWLISKSWVARAQHREID